MAKQVYQQWYWGDWFGDANVARLDPDVRCVWFELLGIMHQNNASSISDDISSLARATRVRERIVEKALEKIAEKKVAEVSEKDGIFTIISRRLLREQAQKLQKSERQRRWRDGNRDADVDAHVDGRVDAHVDGRVDTIETHERRETRARYSDTHIKEIYKEKNMATIIEKIYASHPKPAFMHPSVMAICDAIEYFVDRGMNHEDAADEVLQATQAYKAATDLWPKDQKKFIVRSDNWFKGGCYLDDPATWTRDDDHKSPSPFPNAGDDFEREVERERAARGQS